MHHNHHNEGRRNEKRSFEGGRSSTQKHNPRRRETRDQDDSRWETNRSRDDRDFGGDYSQREGYYDSPSSQSRQSGYQAEGRNWNNDSGRFDRQQSERMWRPEGDFAGSRDWSDRGESQDFYGRQTGSSYRSDETRSQGQHVGKGPKGYRRSDERIREEICNLLTSDAHIDASDIEVFVKEGEVTLRGMVEGREMKRQVEDALEGLGGITEVHNELRTQQSQSANRSGESRGEGRESRGEGRESKSERNSGEGKGGDGKKTWAA